jgi:hypothetical protein
MRIANLDSLSNFVHTFLERALQKLRFKFFRSLLIHVVERIAQ